MIKHATAQVWQGGSEFVLSRVPMPQPAEQELLVQIDLSTVCGSDRHTVSGRRQAACPSVLGHEAVGTIVGIGQGGVLDRQGIPFEVGDRVVWAVTVPCLECDRCARGLTAKCRKVLKTGHEPFHGVWPLSGTYASHIILPAGITVTRVPENISAKAAAVSACAGATVMACCEAASATGDFSGLRVLINGAGMLGLFACAVVRDRGAHCVEIRDTSPERVALAREFGATQSVVVGQGEEPSRLRDEEDFDVAIELSGALAGVRACLDAVGTGSTVVLAGSVAPAGTLELDPERVVRSWLRIAGVHNYEPRHLQAAMDFLSESGLNLPWDKVIVEPVPLRELPGLLTDIETDPTVLRRSVAPFPGP